MSGTPMYTRLEFPYLNNFLMLGEIVKIQQAVLTICPTAHSYDTIPLPPKLNLFYHDPTSNNQGNAVTGGTSSSASVLTGNLDSNYPNYVFDITSFISEQMGKIGYSKWALSVSIPRDEQNTTLYRLVFGDQNYWYKNNESRDYQVQLRVTYVTYGGNNF